jgi:hypothetical protein
MKIDDMPAGREMDALIAEKVFGLEVYRSKRDWIQTGMPHMAEWSEAVGYPAYWHPPFELATYVPEYSTNLIAAWEVVGELKNYDYWLNLTFEMTYFPSEDKTRMAWQVNFRGRKCGFGCSDNPALAICRAALKAVGEVAE